MQRILLALAAVAAVPTCSTPGDRPELPFHLVEGQPMYDVVPRDGIPAIDDPVFVDAETAAAFMRDDEPVLGLVGPDGSAKCYSAWHLDAHEIVNDVIDERPIAATW